MTRKVKFYKRTVLLKYCNVCSFKIRAVTCDNLLQNIVLIKSVSYWLHCCGYTGRGNTVQANSHF